MSAISEVATKLSASSRRHFVDPHEVIEWPDVISDSEWCMSPELTSLHGTSVWDSMGETQRKALCFREAVSFFSVNLYGEAALLAGIAQRVNNEAFADISEYLRHFIDEENKHSMWFARFCNQYSGKLYPERKVAFPTESEAAEEGEEDFVFFAQIALFEELIDPFNVAMAADERLAPVVREINRLHHADETRHLQFGRKLMLDMWQRSAPRWTTATRQRVRLGLDQYVETIWRQLFNPSVYADVGIGDPARVAMDAWRSRQPFRDEMSKGCVKLLSRLDAIGLDA